ncbi:MAG: hypothetical protein AB7I52_12905, partial [Rhizobiaceae bacterium]
LKVGGRPLAHPDDVAAASRQRSMRTGIVSDGVIDENHKQIAGDDQEFAVAFGTKVGPSSDQQEPDFRDGVCSGIANPVSKSRWRPLPGWVATAFCCGAASSRAQIM